MLKPRRPNRPAVEEPEEPPRRFHQLHLLLDVATRAEAAASNQALHEALAAGACVWGFRTHLMKKDLPKWVPGYSCSRCGYTDTETKETGT